MTRQPFRMAPERVGLEVIGWSGFDTPAGDIDGYEPRLHRIIYYAEFGDPGSTYAAPEKGLPAWRDRNRAFGPLAAHVYRQPGPYKIRMWAYEIDSDRRAYWEQEIVVEDPDLAFAGSDVYISAAGDFSNAPAGHAGTFTSLAAAFDARRAFPVTRYIFKSGERHENHTELYMDFEEGGLRFAAHFVTDGEDPVVFAHDPSVTSSTSAFRVCAGRDTARPDAEIVFQNIHVEGNWNEVTETGAARQNGWRDFAGRHHMEHFLLDRCAALRCNQGVASEGDAFSERPEITLHDCVIERFRDYGVWVGGVPRVNFLGCRIVRGLDAASGGPKTSDPFHNNHGPVRLNAFTKSRVLFDGCDLFSRAGWFENIPGWRSQQPCIRINQASIPGSLFNLQRSALEGGFYIIDASRRDNGITTGIQNIIIDKFVMVASHMSTTAIEADGGGITARNGLFIVSDTPRVATVFQTTSFLSTQTPNNNPAAADAPLEIWHNTIVNKLTDAHAPTGDAEIAVVFNEGAFTDVRLSNNLVHQPGASGFVPIVDPGELSTEILWTPRELGYISQEQPQMHPEYATPVDTVQKSAPRTAPDVIGNATDQPESHFDIHGHKRPGLPSVGAMEAER